MKFPLRGALLSASALSLVAAPNAVVAQQSNAPEDDRSSANDLLTDTIIVTASKTDPLQADNQSPPEQIAIPADAAGIAARAPGGHWFRTALFRGSYPIAVYSANAFSAASTARGLHPAGQTPWIRHSITRHPS